MLNNNIALEVKRRRSFAIIAHPDAGKTSLTEKLLLFGGAILLAGEVKAKKNRIKTRSDWMALERERGISIVTSAMSFCYRDIVFNLLDTPGHKDFADDTYRTLSAVDSVVMVLDGAKGIEERSLKLFEICRHRSLPIMVFINKMDHYAKESLALLDEIEQKLNIKICPMNWPIGSGRDYKGNYDFWHKRFLGQDQVLDQPQDPAPEPASAQFKGESRPISAQEIADLLPIAQRQSFCEEIELAQLAYNSFDRELYLKGELAPVFFGSALKQFGVKSLLHALIDYAPAPKVTLSDERAVLANEEQMTGFVFKIQANMDPNHRDRVAFFRICSGRLSKAMKAYIVRSNKMISLSAPQFFFAQKRELAQEAYAGDVIAIANHGNLRIGDSLTEGEKLNFSLVPNFAPEILRYVYLAEAMKAKKLKEALLELAQEGAVQVFMPQNGSQMIIGVIGSLQLDVLSYRLEHEYRLKTRFAPTRFNLCRWLFSENKEILQQFMSAHSESIAHDLDGSCVFLAENLFSLNYEAQRAPQINFLAIKN